MEIPEYLSDADMISNNSILKKTTQEENSHSELSNYL